MPVCRSEAATQFLEDVRSYKGLIPVEVTYKVPDEVYIDELAQVLYSGIVQAWREQKAREERTEELIAAEPNVIDIRDRLKAS